mgnify:CR=1 FL=1
MPVVAKLSEIPNMGSKQIELGGQGVILFNFKGTVYAFENECPHQGAPLGAAIVKDGHLSCPRHGYRFNLEDGKCKEHPEFSLKVWPVRMESGDVVID